MSFLCFVQWNGMKTTSIIVFIVFLALYCVNIFTWREHTVILARNNEVLRECHWYDERRFESRWLLKGWIATSRQIILLVVGGIEIKQIHRGDRNRKNSPSNIKFTSFCWFYEPPHSALVLESDGKWNHHHCWLQKSWSTEPLFFAAVQKSKAAKVNRRCILDTGKGTLVFAKHCKMNMTKVWLINIAQADEINWNPLIWLRVKSRYLIPRYKSMLRPNHSNGSNRNFHFSTLLVGSLYWYCMASISWQMPINTVFCKIPWICQV